MRTLKFLCNFTCISNFIAFLQNYQHYILQAKSNFTLLLYIPFLGIGEWYYKFV